MNDIDEDQEETTGSPNSLETLPNKRLKTGEAAYVSVGGKDSASISSSSTAGASHSPDDSAADPASSGGLLDPHGPLRKTNSKAAEPISGDGGEDDDEEDDDDDDEDKSVSGSVAHSAAGPISITEGGDGTSIVDDEQSVAGSTAAAGMSPALISVCLPRTHLI